MFMEMRALEIIKNTLKIAFFVGHLIQIVRTEGGRPSLLCANQGDIREVDTEDGSYDAVVSNLKYARFLDYGYAKNILVWTDTGLDGGTIYSTPLVRGKPVTKLVGGFNLLQCVAVDWIHSKIYWSDSGSDSIGVVNFDGSSLKTLFEDNFDEPRALVINPLEGWMFWADWGMYARIERAGMDGSHRSVIKSSLMKPKGLAIDFPSRRIFWIDSGSHILASVAYDGSDYKVIVSSAEIVNFPFSLDVFGEWAYWTEWSSGSESIYRINMSSVGTRAQRVVGGVRAWNNLMGIKIFHQSKQPPGPNRCGSNNGGCSELCLPAPDLTGSSPKFTCACPDGEYGNKCLKFGDHPTLLYANGKDIRNVDLESKKDGIVVRGTHSAKFIDYHFEKGIIVWTDSLDGKIYSTPLKTGLPIKELVGELHSPGSVAVDWIHDKIYWTDISAKSIGVAMLNGSFVKTLFKDDLDSPKEIVINPLDGWMFWTDAGENPRIERSGMDGFYRSVVVVEEGAWTHCLTIDFSSQKIYWADSNTRAISSANYDGTKKQVIWESQDALRNPYSLDVFKGSFYWAKWTDLEETVYNWNGQNLTKIVNGNATLGGIKVYHRSKQPSGPNRCGVNNGGCSHLCLPSPDQPKRTTGFSCACPDGLFLSQDGSSCSTVEPELQEHFVHELTEKISTKLGAKIGVITIGVLIGLTIVGLVSFYIYRRHSRRTVSDHSFDNPVFCKAKEDELTLPSHM